jgi:hypothetical protein
MTTITCKIPEMLDAQLEAAAVARKVSKSQLVRESLEQTLPKKIERKRLSLRDRMRDACGMVKSGVTDLASNPRHMEAFGED